MDRKIYAIFTAGGSGVRMGAPIPKQFLPLCGKPILRRTIEAFVEAVPSLNVIVTLPRGQMEWWKRYCREDGFNCPHTVVAGGITRFHSVRNALAKVPDGAMVMIHDGVRPLVRKDLLEKMLARMQSCRALVPVMPAVETLASLRRGEDGNPVETGEPSPDRSRVFSVQTPQIFLSEDIRSAYTQAYDESFTDDASVARRKQIPIDYIDGDRFNIKITTPEDLRIAELYFPLTQI